MTGPRVVGRRPRPVQPHTKRWYCPDCEVEWTSLSGRCFHCHQPTGVTDSDGPHHVPGATYPGSLVGNVRTIP